MLCILYTIALGWSLGLIGLLAERALPATAPRRWIWCLTIALSIVTPAYYQANHNVVVPSTHSAGDPSWWSLLSLGLVVAAVVAAVWLIRRALRPRSRS